MVPNLLEGRTISSGLPKNSELNQMEDALLRDEDLVIHSNRTPWPRSLEEKLLNMTLKEGVSESASHSVMSDSLRPHGLYSPWNSPGQNTGVGSPLLLQEIFPTQGSNPGLLHCRWILHQLSY